MTPSMNPVELWTSALRSGDYKQGEHTLVEWRGDNGAPRHCCLGVACDLYIKHALEDETEKEKLRDAMYSMNVLPHEVKKWLGLKYSFGRFSTIEGELDSLVSLNDVRRLDFNTIADIIEQQPEGLFGPPAEEETNVNPKISS